MATAVGIDIESTKSVIAAGEDRAAVAVTDAENSARTIIFTVRKV